LLPGGKHVGWALLLLIQ